MLECHRPSDTFPVILKPEHTVFAQFKFDNSEITNKCVINEKKSRGKEPIQVDGDQNQKQQCEFGAETMPVRVGGWAHFATLPF